MSTLSLMVYFILCLVVVLCSFIAGIFYQRKKQAFKVESLQGDERIKSPDEPEVESNRAAPNLSIEEIQPAHSAEYKTLAIKLSNLLRKPLDKLSLSGNLGALRLRVAQAERKTKSAQRDSLPQPASVRRSTPEQLSFSNRPVRHSSSKPCQEGNDSALDYSIWKTKKKEREEALRKKESEKKINQEQIKLLKQTEEQEKIKRQLHLAERLKYFKSLADNDLDYLWLVRGELDMDVDEERVLRLQVRDRKGIELPALYKGQNICGNCLLSASNCICG